MTIPHSSSLVVLVAILALAATATAQKGPPAFTDYGVGANVAECRGVVTTQTADGRCLAIASALDEGPISYVLVTDIDTGETKQHFCPEDVRQSPPYGSLMHSNGKFYTTQGGIFLEFDPAAGEWTFHANGSPIGGAYIGFTEAPDGKVWAGSVYQTGLISFDPKTRELKDHGRMDPKEKYTNYLAADEAGWIYSGIGTARCNIIAYNPATGEKRQLVKEEDRVTGSGNVYPTNDGAVCGVAVGQYYRLFEGQATPIEKADVPPRREVGNIGWGQRSGSFPDGRRVRSYNMPDKWLEVEDTKTGEVKRIEFEYEAGGVLITSLGLGPKGIVYGSTCHPMHLLALDTNNGELRDYGAVTPVGGGNFCAIAAQGDIIVGAQYSAGRLWLYDVNKPFTWASDYQPSEGHITGAKLVEVAKEKCPGIAYNPNSRIAVFQTREFDTVGYFPFTVPADGTYYLHAFPHYYSDGCVVKWLLDGEDTGKQFVPIAGKYGAAPMVVFGLLELTAGDHTLGAKTVEVEGSIPLMGLSALIVDTQQLDKVHFQNPRAVAQWHDDVCRPRTALAHPDGKHVMMAGYAGYGLCGGGIGIYNLETEEETLLTAEKDLLPSHSCITLKALSNGDLVGGTAIGAPGGGHQVATAAELFIVDWETKKLGFHAAPPDGATSIVSIQAPADGLVYGLTGKSTFFVFDPKTKEFTHSESFEEYGGVPRHALQIGPDGNLYAAMTGAIVKITPDTLEHVKLAATPTNVTSGGPVVNGLLVFAHSSHVWTYRIPGL